MKVINAGYEILTPISDDGIEELKRIEKIGRVCYKSEDKITDDGESAKKFVDMLINNHHEAMLEHGSISVLFTVDRGVTHEMVRHRLASFAQESTRYANYSKDKFGNEITVIKPCFWEEGSEEYQEWYKACEFAEKSYMKLLNTEGVIAQQARSVLPTSTKADITITANYREWRHILNLRACDATGPAHPQIKEVMVPLLKDLQSRLPIIFDDLK